MIDKHIDLLKALPFALDNLQTNVYIKDRKLRYVYANKHTLTLFGCNAEELNLSDDSKFFPSDLVPILRNVDLKVLSGESSEEEIIVDDGKSGKKVYLEVKTPIHSDNDNDLIIGILGISTDITAQKSLIESEIKLDFERLQLQTIITTTPDLVWLKDENGVFLNCNKRFESLYGASLKDICGKTDYDFVDKELADFFRFHDKAAMQSSHALVNEEQLTFTDGHTEQIETTKRAVLDQDGKIIGVLGIGRNVTEHKQDEDKLRKSEERYALAMQGSRDGLWDWNVLTGEIVYSSRWKSMLGYEENEIGNDLAEGERRLHPDDKSRVLSNTAELMARKTRKYNIEFRMLHKNGHYINILSRAFAVEDETGKVIRVVGTHVDITELKKSEENLKLAASVFTHAGECIVITDANGIIIDINDAFTTITGYSREEAIGQNPRFLHSGRQSSEFYADMWKALLKESYWYGELWNRRKNGEIYAEMKTISAVRDERGITTHYVSLGNDITPIKEHQAQLEHIAHYDVLTNLPNRVLLADRLSQAMLQCSRHVKSLSVVFLDLDGFKAVNDTYGHDVGDELLIALSLRMKEALREGDTLSRIGGDEFVAVLVDLDAVEDCEPVLERLLLATSEPVTIGDIVLNVSASIGVTLYPQDNVVADQLMRHADQAMYVAKQSGKNCYHLFDTAQNDAVKMQEASLAAIRRALDNQEFVLHYQPNVNMRTGEVRGVEALIRWQHPERGLLNPIEFLPVIEKNPMSIEMGEWVIDSALSQISQWQTIGLNQPVSISVNISAIQLQHPNFTQRLAKLLAGHPDVQAHHLELEVLETSTLNDVVYVSKIMDACMALGVKFALDDFGTGYSSLTHLRQLPVKLIKIDRSFVRDILDNADDLALVEGVIALAKLFKRDVIAEGVESIEHATTLLQLGCDYIQGYGIAKPMKASDIPTWVNDWKPDVNWQPVKVWKQD